MKKQIITNQEKVSELIDMLDCPDDPIDILAGSKLRDGSTVIAEVVESNDRTDYTFFADPMIKGLADYGRQYICHTERFK